MHPILFKLPASLGGIEVPSYGVLMALGMMLGAFVFAELAHRSGFERGKAFEVALETMLVSLVMSKVVGILFQPASGMSVWQIVGKTGGVWYVGFLTGVGWAWWRLRSMGMVGMHGLDMAAAAVASGHAVGRLGCFMAGCCWGGACDAPWAVTFTDPRAHALTGVPLDVPVHPTQLYESGAEALTAVLLIWMIVGRHYRFHGQPGMTYLLLYAVVRFTIEMFRVDPRGGVGPFSTSQWIAIGVACVALPVMVVGLKRGTIHPGKPPVPGGEVREGSARRATQRA